MAKRNISLGPEATLDNSLLLNRWMLSRFAVDSLEQLARNMKDPTLEGYDDNHLSHYYHVLNAELRTDLPIREKLREYDANIYRHTCHINRLGKREEPVRWKYFQYLYLLMCEYYFDRYFGDRKALLDDINSYRYAYFCKNGHQFYTDPFSAEPVKEDEINKIACWCATGAGKTLLMHVNKLQVDYYAEKNGVKFGNLLLVTPNAGLSSQHIEELKKSDILCYRFDKSKLNDTYKGQYLQVIEITKLNDEDGDKSVDVECFEKKNFVLVDEGHKGTSGEQKKWKPNRNKLSEQGFCIEYSATFKQSIESEKVLKKRNTLLREYGVSTLFNYSYRYFYDDGYGKDFQTKNISENFDEHQRLLYMLGGLLGFYEQVKLYADLGDEAEPFMIEKPVAIFVGNTVASGGANKEVSDIVKIVEFFQLIVSKSDMVVNGIEALLHHNDGLIVNNHSVFEGSFGYICNMDARSVYSDLLDKVFNCPQLNANVHLHLDRLSGVNGEIGLRMGDGRYFGVVNVGEPKSVTDAFENRENIVAGLHSYGGSSLFESINDDNSRINILIGAKKFTEGWSSWRVSTMCLLNVGSGDGSEIIQLFGRGVRLKGYRYSLKRTNRLDSTLRPAREPKYISILETLNIFGIEANYMDEFSRIIKSEGMGSHDAQSEQVRLPLMPNIIDIDKCQLKYLRLKKGMDFVRQETCVRLEEDVKIHVMLDRYLKGSVFESNHDKNRETLEEQKNQVWLTDDNRMQYIHWTKLMFDLRRYKCERGWYNLFIDDKVVRRLARSQYWYTLYMPEISCQWTDFKRDTDKWQEVLTTLLKMYIERFYQKRRRQWEAQYMEVTTLTEDMAGLGEEDKKKGIVIKIKEEWREQFFDDLKRVQKQLEDESFAQSIRIGGKGGFKALYFERHFYSPLMYFNKDSVRGDEQPIEITPVALNEGESRFVVDLTEYFNNHEAELEKAGKEIYLLRNRSQVGANFFSDAGFYPDFILWIVKDRHQYVTFIDPHGLVYSDEHFEDPKVALYATLQSPEELGIKDDNLTLNSFILSPTPMQKVASWLKKGSTKEEILQAFHEHHVYFFKDEDVSSYLNDMMKQIVTI
ncbi:MAG: DEAD/DEAH box helicase family protein [Prevotella sp.]|nr:DEAD/DEAH box helicase family protein [Prevotella sp.]